MYNTGPWLGFKNCECRPLIFWEKVLNLGTYFDFIYEKFRIMSYHFQKTLGAAAPTAPTLTRNPAEPIVITDIHITVCWGEILP